MFDIETIDGEISTSRSSSTSSSSDPDIHRCNAYKPHVPPRQIMIGIDDSENSERAFRWYLDYMHEDEDHVLLVHVMEPSLTYGIEMSPRTVRKLAKDMTGCTGPCEVLATQYLRRANESGIKNCEMKMYIDSRPGHSLVQVARCINVDAIILGSRGNGRFRRTFLGSVSEYVLHHAHTPVTIIPPYNITPRRQSQCCGRGEQLLLTRKLKK